MFKAALLVFIDDLLAVVREFLNPQVSHSGLDSGLVSGLARSLRRHGVGKLRDLQAKSLRPKHRAFKACEPGYPLPGRALRSNVTRGGMRTSGICLTFSVIRAVTCQQRIVDETSRPLSAIASAIT